MAGLCMKKKLLRSKCDAKVVKNMDLDQNGRVLQFFKIAHLRVDLNFPKCWHGISMETAQPFTRRKIIKQFIMTLIMTMRALIFAIHHSQKLNNTTNLKVKQQRNGQNQSKRY